VMLIDPDQLLGAREVQAVQSMADHAAEPPAEVPRPLARAA
jgi:hypothetical protein